MIKKKGVVNITNDSVDTKRLLDSIKQLPEGEYNYIIYDNSKNRPLPQLKYLFGVVLKTISDNLPGNPPVESLYSYFEEVYAPIHVAYINGEKFEYFDLKNEKSIEMDDVIKKIIHHATNEWGIKIPEKDDLMTPGAKELYVDAYLDMWKLHINK